MGRWIPLMDFAIKKGVSLSTLRRYIKAKRIPYRIEKGRYLLQDVEDVSMFFAPPAAAPLPQLLGQTHPSPEIVRKLERELLKAREEIAELKTLIALYEERLPTARLNT